MSEKGGAHFLHERRGIESVLSPPVDRPRAIDWVRGKEDRLVMASADGDLLLFSPLEGLRELAKGLEDPAAICVSPDGRRMVVVERGHRITIRSPVDGHILAERDLALLSDIHVAWFERPTQGVAIVGDTLDGRRALIADPELERRRLARIPPRVAVGSGRKKTLLWAKNTAEGLDVAPFGRPLKPGEATSHRVRFSGSGVVIGMADGGLSVWTGTSSGSQTIPLYDLTSAAVDPSGVLVALGTRGGQVLFTSVLGDKLSTAQPGRVGGHSGPVRALAFAAKGRWLASAGDELRLWRW